MKDLRLEAAYFLHYVLDQNSGNFAGYSLQWNRTEAAAGRVQQGLLVTLVKGNARTAGIRE